jgi:hypothetical protein
LNPAFLEISKKIRKSQPREVARLFRKSVLDHEAKESTLLVARIEKALSCFRQAEGSLEA